MGVCMADGGRNDGENPDEWQSVWAASSAAPIRILGTALELTVEQASLDDPGPKQLGEQKKQNSLRGNHLARIT